MKKLNHKKGPARNATHSVAGGFTLLELLVVVAIIGILVSVVLVALSSARGKGVDGAVKANLVNGAKQAEVFFGTNTASPDSYANVCTNAGAVGGALPMGPQVLAAAKAAGLSTYSQDAAQNGSAPYMAICNDGTGAAWAAEAPLSISGQFWCVDSTGKSKQTTGTSISAAADVTCQ